MPRIKDLTGKRFGRLIVIKYTGKTDKRHNTLWLCKCDCGNITEANSYRLKNGEIKSCGCLYKENLKKINGNYNLIGKKYSLLTVLEEAYVKNGKKYWKCICDCGNISYRTTTELVTQEIKSCGCLKKNKLPIKIKGTRLYRIWSGMKRRCNNISDREYKYYGGRGIKVCNEWNNSSYVFYNWAMTNGYKDNLTLDRIDVNGNYEPNNCRWVTWKVQENNRRNNDFIEYNGEKHTLKEWSEILSINISQSVLWSRIRKYNWSIEKAFTTPVYRRKNGWKNREKTRNQNTRFG